MTEKEIIKNGIISRQFNKNIDQLKFIIFDIEYGGFGAMVSRRKLAMQFGLYFNRNVIFNYTDYMYDDPYKCISRYSLNDMKEKIYTFNFNMDQEDKVVYFDFNYYWNKIELRKKYHELSVGNINFKEFSGILLNLLELNDEYKIKLEEKKRELNFNSLNKIIGIHIRRGDKEVESPFIPISRFIDELRIISKKTGIKNVLLCSDSSNVYKEVKKDLSDFNIIYDSTEIRYDNKNSNLCIVAETRTLAKEETFSCVKNIELLSECDYIIGQSNVQFAKIAGCKLIDKKNNLDVLTLIDPFTLKNINWDLLGTGK